MRQEAKVIAVLPEGEARVSIKRASACGHECTSCGACGAQAKPILTEAKNPIGAAVGDTVEVESKTSKILGLAFVVYLVPVILFIGFYCLCAYYFKSEGVSILGAFLGLGCGVVISVLLNRKEAKKKTTCTIVKVIS